MIVEAICNLLFGIASLILSVFPTFPSFESLNTSLAPLFYVVRFVNLFVDIQAVGRCLLIVLVVYNLKFAWSAFMWLVRKIPGVS